MQALREELARQRTTFIGGNLGADVDPELAAQYAAKVRQLEDQVLRWVEWESAGCWDYIAV